MITWKFSDRKDAIEDLVRRGAPSLNSDALINNYVQVGYWFSASSAVDTVITVSAGFYFYKLGVMDHIPVTCLHKTVRIRELASIRYLSCSIFVIRRTWLRIDLELYSE